MNLKGRKECLEHSYNAVIIIIIIIIIIIFVIIIIIILFFFLQIAGDFCAWLRQLPEGEWNTLNELPEEHVRALFATGQCATNPARSKLAEGLKSWAAFGLQVSGGKAEEIAAIARQQVMLLLLYQQISSTLGA
jgi:amino acid transporter